jgi:hypothetical protein
MVKLLKGIKMNKLMFNCIQLGPTTCKCVALFDRNEMCTKLGGFYNECSLACLLMPQFFQYPK